jgi:predicted metal-dependent phosphotriesterase family hydrolase
VLTTFVALLRDHGVSEGDVRRILVDNPRDLLTVLTPIAIQAASGSR